MHRKQRGRPLKEGMPTFDPHPSGYTLPPPEKGIDTVTGIIIRDIEYPSGKLLRRVLIEPPTNELEEKKKIAVGKNTSKPPEFSLRHTRQGTNIIH